MRSPAFPCHPRRLIAGVLLLVSACLAPAQDPAKVQLRLLTLPPKATHPPVYLSQGKAAAIKLETTATWLAGPYPAVRRDTWVFTSAPAAADKEAQPVVLASCKATPAGEQLVVLVRNRDNSGTYGAFALDLDRKSFDQRQFLVVNLSQRELAAEIGGKRVALASGKTVVVSPQADQGPDLCHATFFSRKDDAWQPFLAANWPLRDKVRGLVFLYQSAGGNKILLHAISDFL